jgi:hypothetical protein
MRQKEGGLARSARTVNRRGPMKTMWAREAENAFGLMIGAACAEPVIETRGRGVVMVISVEEYERLLLLANDAGRTPTRLARRRNLANEAFGRVTIDQFPKTTALTGEKFVWRA